MCLYRLPSLKRKLTVICLNSAEEMLLFPSNISFDRPLKFYSSSAQAPLQTPRTCWPWHVYYAAQSDSFFAFRSCIVRLGGAAQLLRVQREPGTHQSIAGVPLGQAPQLPYCRVPASLATRQQVPPILQTCFSKICAASSRPVRSRRHAQQYRP